MTTPFTYDFGYSWPIVWGQLIPIVLFGGLAALGLCAWLAHAGSWSGPASLAGWGLFAPRRSSHVLFGINLPAEICRPEQFLASGSGEFWTSARGRVGRRSGLLLARPRTAVTALDIYSGYFGIDDNTPERLMMNARIAGVADRAEATVGDARAMPLADASYDGGDQHLRHRSPEPRRDPHGAIRKWRACSSRAASSCSTIVNVDWLGAPGGAVSTRARAPSGAGSGSVAGASGEQRSSSR